MYTYLVHHVAADADKFCDIQGELYLFQSKKKFHWNPSKKTWDEIVKKLKIPYNHYQGEKLELYDIDKISVI